MIIVLDQGRPDTITRYGMKNVQELQRKGTSFNALVGDMAAETVISHNVITSGLFPKHMGWTNEVYRDTEDVLRATPHADLTAELLHHLEHVLRPVQGSDRARELPRSSRTTSTRDSGRPQASEPITQKRTSACTAGHTSAFADGNGTDPEDIILPDPRLSPHVRHRRQPRGPVA